MSRTRTACPTNDQPPAMVGRARRLGVLALATLAVSLPSIAPAAAAAHAHKPKGRADQVETWNLPSHAAVALEIRVAGDTDRAEVDFVGLAVAIVQRDTVSVGVRDTHFRGVGWQKPRGDRAKVRISAKLRVVRRSASPSISIKLGKVGDVVVEVFARGRRLVHQRSNGERSVNIELDVATLDGLPALPRRLYKRRALAFYYAWYGHPQGPTGRWRHWNPKNKTYDVTDTPTLGYYDSASPAVINQHAQWAKMAGLDGLVLSWWSDNEPGDALLAQWLDVAAAHDLTISVYIENTGSVDDLRRSVQRLIKRHGVHSAWQRQDGKPVVFTYGRVDERISVEGIAEALGDLDLFVCAMGLDSEKLDQVDALHAYYHARHYERYVGGLDILNRAAALRDVPMVATVMPGYDDRVIRTPGFAMPRGDGARWRHDWAVARSADWALLTSFNEWHEGSEIEPSVEYGDTWLKLTAAAVARWKAGQ